MSNEDGSNPSENSSPFGEMAEYVQVFIEESSDELEHLVEATLMLEKDPRNVDALQRAFRMLHSLKGSCGMMGFEVAGDLAHRLEDQFELYRSQKLLINESASTLILKSIDYFREFINRLRNGEKWDYVPNELLDELATLNLLDTNQTSKTDAQRSKSNILSDNANTLTGGIRLQVTFRQGLPLADLKARLIVTKLSSIGEVINCDPPVDETDSFEDLRIFSLTIITNRTLEEVRQLIQVDGVESVDIIDNNSPLILEANKTQPKANPIIHYTAHASQTVTDQAPPKQTTNANSSEKESTNHRFDTDSRETATGSVLQEGRAPTESPSDSNILIDKAPITATSQTIRVEIDRLDHLMNLTGELVISNATFAQLSHRLETIFSGTFAWRQSKDLSQRLKSRILELKKLSTKSYADSNALNQCFAGLEEELELLEIQSENWKEGTERFAEVQTAIDQLSRVSSKLQRCVLQTRMVPVAPLFNRFKRVVRDLSVSQEKQVSLVIRGEKTELDKQMIDSLGEPLLHLVRNCFDHGIETTAERIQSNKSPLGTLTLEASHLGNNVFIRISDDGTGIRIDKIKQNVLQKGLATDEELKSLPDDKIIDYIWKPGFSTADVLTDISGRGMGMDIVRDSIHRLNGTIDVSTIPNQGTTFTIRLPLTLAIIHSLTIKIRDTLFSLPMDDIREIVAIPMNKVVRLNHCSAIEVRGKLIPLIDLHKQFQWNRDSRQLGSNYESTTITGQSSLNVVVLQVRGKLFGLKVDQLIGRSNIVIKSLTENFRAVKGLSGASITGDGEVCLMLDPVAVTELAITTDANIITGN